MTLGAQGHLWTTPGARCGRFQRHHHHYERRHIYTSSGGALRGIVHDPWNYHAHWCAAGSVTLTGSGSISALDITLDGTATISGQLTQSPHPDNGVAQDAMIYAGHDLTVGAHGNITLGDNGLIGAGTSNSSDSQQNEYSGSVTMETAQTSASRSSGRSATPR